MPCRWLFLLLAFAATLATAMCGGQDDAGQRDPELVAQGEGLYLANCAQCHGLGTGGSITDIPPPHNANGHTWHHPDRQLMDIVLNGLDFAVEGQQTMPAFKDSLTPEQVRAILAYIETWWTEEQRAHQATVTAQSER